MSVAPIDAENTLSFLGFKARQHSLNECEERLAALSVNDM